PPSRRVALKLPTRWLASASTPQSRCRTRSSGSTVTPQRNSISSTTSATTRPSRPRHEEPPVRILFLTGGSSLPTSTPRIRPRATPVRGREDLLEDPRRRRRPEPHAIHTQDHGRTVKRHAHHRPVADPGATVTKQQLELRPMQRRRHSN